MSITEKGPGDVSYSKGKVKNLKKMPDGNPFPYEFTYIAESGVQDDEKADEFKNEPKYNPSAEKQTGDSGNG